MKTFLSLLLVFFTFDLFALSVVLYDDDTMGWNVQFAVTGSQSGGTVIGNTSGTLGCVPGPNNIEAIGTGPLPLAGHLAITFPVPVYVCAEADTAPGNFITATSANSWSFSTTGADLIFHFNTSGPCTNNCVTNVPVNIHNNTGAPIFVKLMGAGGQNMFGGSPDDPPGLGIANYNATQTLALDAGDSFVDAGMPIPCNQYPLSVVPANSDGDTLPSGGASTTTNSQGVAIMTTNAFPPTVMTNADGSFSVNQPTPSFYNPTNQAPGTGIQWSPSINGTNVTVATEQGDGALYDALTKGFGTLNGDLVGATNWLGAIASNTRGIGTNGFSVVVTNIGGGGGTNGNFPTNLNLQATQLGIANTLSNLYNTGVGISNLLANGTNGGPNTNSLASLLPYTDVSTLNGMAAASLSGPVATLGSMGTALAALNNGIGSGGSEMDFVINAAAPGQPPLNFEIKPESGPVGTLFAGLYSTVHALFVFILFVAYAYAVIKQLVETVKILAAAPGAKVMPLDTAGFNVAGPVLFIGAVAAYLVISAALFAFVISGLVGGMDWDALVGNVSGGTAGIFSAMDGGAMHFLIKVFPLALACSLVLSYLLWRLGVVATTALAVTVMRIIPM